MIYKLIGSEPYYSFYAGTAKMHLPYIEHVRHRFYITFRIKKKSVVNPYSTLNIIIVPCISKIRMCESDDRNRQRGLGFRCNQ